MTHYHNVFLVRASNKISALKLTQMFLAPFDENLEVKPYREYLNENDIKHMAEYYKVDPTDLDSLLLKLKDWDGDSGGIQEGRLFYVRTQNPEGQWDYYQFGGRWMWSNLIKDNMDKIVKPGTNHYWNRFHDNEVKGKTWTITYPDGTVHLLEYGQDFEIRKWVSNHPELSEVVDATEIDFTPIIEKLKQSYRKSVKFWGEQKDNEETSEDIKNLYKKKIDQGLTKWTADCHFWNITDNSYNYDVGEIKTEPKRWYLVNVDLHS